MNFCSWFPLLLLMGSLMCNLSKARHFEKEKKKKALSEFEIVFKNIRLKCWMEFTNPCLKETKLIILTMSRRNGLEKRNGIRQTWMKEMAEEEIRFLIADPSPGEATEVPQKLEQEQKENNDLVFLHCFNDTYSHIHLKWYGGLQWQQSFCAGAEWVMKADDDSVVHLRRLAHWTEKKFRQIAIQQNALVYFGFLLYWMTPIRNPNSKWFVSKDEYPADAYPEYMSGPVYLTTPATVAAVLSHSHETDGFGMDDVLFTGILAKLANVKLSDQKEHFVWSNSFYATNDCCVDGVPTPFSMWGAHNGHDFEQFYHRLDTKNCTFRKTCNHTVLPKIEDVPSRGGTNWGKKAIFVPLLLFLICLLP